MNGHRNAYWIWPNLSRLSDDRERFGRVQYAVLCCDITKAIARNAFSSPAFPANIILWSWYNCYLDMSIITTNRSVILTISVSLHRKFYPMKINITAYDSAEVPTPILVPVRHKDCSHGSNIDVVPWHESHCSQRVVSNYQSMRNPDQEKDFPFAITKIAHCSSSLFLLHK